MKNFPFKLVDDDSVIVLIAFIDDHYRLRLALDTAASHTTIDSNILFMLGYELKNAIGEVEVETSNGIILVEEYNLGKLSSINIEKTDFVVQVYDFLAHGVTSDYDGVLGLDFLKNRKICIDFESFILSVK
jgi:hypothetical protein